MTSGGCTHGAGGRGERRPLFVVGCERSGTTLLTVMLGRHPALAMMPETHFFLRVVPRHPERAATHAEILRRFFDSPRERDIGLSREEVTVRFEGMPPTYPNLFETLLALYAERWGKRLAGEKTPFHLLRVPLILEWFPEARIVCIIRDGRDVVRSILSAPWTAHRSLRRQACKWTQCARLARTLLRDYPRNFHVIRYEDLVTDPETTLRRVNAFYGLAFDAQQLDAGGPSPAVPDRERSWKANAVQRPDESRISAWRDHVTPEERLIMNSLMGPELRTFGYGDTELPAVPLARRVANRMLNAACWMGVYRLAGNIYRYTPRERKRRHAERQPKVPLPEAQWEEGAEPALESGITHSAA